METNVELSQILEGDRPNQPETPAAEKSAPARDEAGRFAAKGETQTEVQEKPADKPVETAPPVADTAPPAEQEPAPNPRESAFLAKANDEKAKRQKAEQQNQEYAKQLQQLQARLLEYERKPAPDLATDPQGHVQHVRQEVEFLRFNDKLDLSEQYARQKFGDELVTEAQMAFQAAAQAQPYLAVQLHQEKDPYGFVLKWHKQQKVLSEMGDDPDGYVERLIAQRQRPATPVTPPPRSLASATGARVSDASVAAEPKSLSNIFGR